MSSHLTKIADLRLLVTLWKTEVLELSLVVFMILSLIFLRISCSTVCGQ
jgi:hypothetical protein